MGEEERFSGNVLAPLPLEEFRRIIQWLQLLTPKYEE